MNNENQKVASTPQVEQPELNTGNNNTGSNSKEGQVVTKTEIGKYYEQLQIYVYEYEQTDSEEEQIFIKRKNISNAFTNILRDMVRKKIHEAIGIKETQLIDRLQVTKLSKTHLYRLLRFVIIEKLVEADSEKFLESYARILDQLPEELIKKGYEFAIESAEGEKLTKKHFEFAVYKILPKLQKNTAISFEKDIANMDKSKRNLAVVTLSDEKLLRLMRRFTSSNIVDTERNKLIDMLKAGE